MNAAIATACTVLSIVSITIAVEIRNASFTDGAAMPTNWDLSHDGTPANVTAGRDSVVYFTAPSSLRLRSGPSGHTEGFVSGLLPAGALVGKTFSVGGKGKAVGGVLNVVIHPFLKNGTNTWGHLGVIDTPDWTDWTFDYTMPDATQLQFASLNFFLSSPGVTAWVDNVTLTVDGVAVAIATAQTAKSVPQGRTLSVSIAGRVVDRSLSSQLAPGIRLLVPSDRAATRSLTLPQQ